MRKEIGISDTNNLFYNPYDETRQIFIFADFPHLLKLARNHFLDKGFIVCGNEHITKSDLEHIKRNQTNDLKMLLS